MKILQVITKSNWGGAQRHVYDLAVECQKLGHNISVALGGSPDGKSELKTKLEAQGVKTISIDSMQRDVSVGKDAASFGSIIKIIYNEEPDVVHLHSPKAAGLGALAARILNTKKIVYTVHGWAFNEDRSILQKTVISFFSWITMIFATDIILLSEREFAQAQLFPFVSKKLSLIPLGITTPKYLSQKSAREFLGPEIKGNHVVGTISELHTNKGLIYSINAISTLVATYPDIVFAIIGEGEQRPYLESLIKEKKLEKHVFLLGKIPDAAIYLKAFNVFTLTSLKEGLPYTILEAGLASLPVIATSVGGIPEIISDMHSGILIQPKKIKEIEHAIDFILKHKNVQKEHGNALRTEILSRFKPEKMLKDVVAVYEKVKKDEAVTKIDKPATPAQ